MENSIIAQVDHLKATIGKSVNGQVNVFVNFNPIFNILMLKQIYNCTAVKLVTNVSYYENGTGGLAVRLADDADEFKLQRCLEQIFSESIID